MTIEATTRVTAPRGGTPPSDPNGSPEGPPRLASNGYESLGLEAMAALLAVESAQEQHKTMRACAREAHAGQLAAMRAQAAAQRERAADTRKEGWVQGSLQIASGALSVASACSGPSGSEKVNDEWLRADARVPGADARWVSAAGRYGDYVHGLERSQKVLEVAGTTVSGLARPIAQATYGAAAIEDEAEGTTRGADAKFFENSASEYEELAHAAAASADKLRQLLGAVSQERNLLMRTLTSR